MQCHAEALWDYAQLCYVMILDAVHCDIGLPRVTCMLAYAYADTCMQIRL